MRKPFIAGIAAGVLACAVGSARVEAQDPFEIQVYEYATVPAGKWNLETHLNFIQRGTTSYEGSVAPTEHQTHLTFELTRGITDWFELAGYLVTARRQGEGAEYVGWRVRPRVRAPDSWKLPVGLSLSTEVGFPKDEYEEADATLEIRPVIEWGRGRFMLDVNPVLGKALSPRVRRRLGLRARRATRLGDDEAAGPFAGVLRVDGASLRSAAEQ